MLLIPSNPFFAEAVALLSGFNDVLMGGGNMVVVTNVLTPDARGRVSITSPSPYQDPEITFGAYEDEGNEDLYLIMNLTVAIRDAAAALNISDSPNTYTILYPPDAAFQNVTLLEEYVKALPVFQNHYAGTLQMGKVVDANLQMYNVDGITVADTSALRINNGNTRTQAILTATQASIYLRATLPPP